MRVPRLGGEGDDDVLLQTNTTHRQDALVQIHDGVVASPRGVDSYVVVHPHEEKVAERFRPPQEIDMPWNVGGTQAVQAATVQAAARAAARAAGDMGVHTSAAVHGTANRPGCTCMEHVPASIYIDDASAFGW